MISGDWGCESFFLSHQNWTGDLWISIPALYHCATLTFGFHLWHFQVFIVWCRGICGGIVLIGPVSVFFTTPGIELDTSGALALHSFTVPQFHVVFISNNFRYFWDSLDLYSYTPPLSHGDIWFHLWHFRVYNSVAEGFVVVLFWLDLWQIFCATGN